jgi:hypothetical protein
MTTLTQVELLSKLAQAAQKAREQNDGENMAKSVKRMEMSRAYFDDFCMHAGVPAGEREIFLEGWGQVAVLAPNDTLADNQFVFEFAD